MFWGDVCDLRRFADGSILEAVVWDDKETVIGDIAAHLLNLHCSIPPSSLTYLKSQVSRAKITS